MHLKYVPERELGKLGPNQPVERQTPAHPERLFGGQIDVAGASFEPQTRVAHARPSVEDAEGQLKAGMPRSCRVRFSLYITGAEKIAVKRKRLHARFSIATNARLSILPIRDPACIYRHHRAFDA